MQSSSASSAATSESEIISAGEAWLELSLASGTFASLEFDHKMKRHADETRRASVLRAWQKTGNTKRKSLFCTDTT